MSRMLIVVFVPLVVLALVLPGKVVAGPPEGVAGRMVFDEVADGLRKYRKETDPANRRRWLKRLVPTNDPRVAVALGEALAEPDPDYVAATLLRQHYMPDFKPTSPKWHHLPAAEWWEENEADLRRRAQQLPQ